MNYCCEQMKVALTHGHSWARLLETNEAGEIYLWIYDTDQEPYERKKVKISYCPFCGKQLRPKTLITKEEWRKMQTRRH